MRPWLEQTQLRMDATVARWNTSLRRFSVVNVLLDTLTAFTAHNMEVLAASLAYYALLALFPLLLVLIALSSSLISQANALETVMRLVRDYLPGSDQEVLQILQQVIELRGPATLFGIVALLWTASGVFDVLQYALDRAWDVPRPRAFWLQRVFSIGVIGGLGIVFLGSVLISTFSEAVVFNLIGGADTAHAAVGWFSDGLSIALGFVAFAILYKTFPHARVSWRAAVWGAASATLLWELAKYGYGLYLAYFARFNLVYGSVGAIIGLLFWGYISAMILLVGAELSARVGKGEIADTKAREME